MAPVVTAPDSTSSEAGQARFDADDIEASPEDEAIVEAEVAGPGIEVLTGVEAEDADLIDEDHDPLDDATQTISTP